MKKRLFLTSLLMLTLVGCNNSPSTSSQEEPSSVQLSSSQEVSSSEESSSQGISSSSTGTSSSESSSSTGTSSSESSSSSGISSSLEEEEQVYTIEFETYDGDEVATIEDEEGTSINKPEDPTKEGYKFIGWTYDSEFNNPVIWPLVLEDNLVLHAKWNKVVNIKELLSNLVSSTQQSPYSFIPDEMKPTYSQNHVSQEDVNYNFETGVDIEDIQYGGFGEQWNMVIDNINESERFYSVILIAEQAITASVSLFNNYLDANPSDTASHELDESTYTASLDYENDVLSYTLELKTNIEVPLFGTVNPYIKMVYDVKDNSKAVSVHLLDNIGMKYISMENHYEFALEYGIEEVTRRAYFEITRDDDQIDGHIYEYVQLKGKDVIGSAADFYIDENYVSVVGNKASGMLGFKGNINELYSVDTGKLLLYEVEETLTIAGVSGEYHTLWFNLNDINGINTVVAIANENLGQYGDNNHDIYVNGQSSIFAPTKNSILGFSTSRKYDIELRTQYFYGYEDDELVKYETKVPMMFIQDDNNKDTNFSDFPSDILSKNNIAASVNVSNSHLTRIREDHNSLIDQFITNKDLITSTTIGNYIKDIVE